MPASERAALREALEAVMREAGDLARATARSAYKSWTKGEDRSPVSDADIAVNDLLRQRLTKLAPRAGWLSEESEEHPPESAPLSAWIVDPIDGTRAYIAGRADWTISVALVEDARPVLAALYAPVTDEMFLASRGEGARLNGAALTVSDGNALAGAKIAGPKRYLDRLGALNAGIVAQPKVGGMQLNQVHSAGHHQLPDWRIPGTARRNRDRQVALEVEDRGVGLAHLVERMRQPVRCAPRAQRRSAILELLGVVVQPDRVRGLPLGERDLRLREMQVGFQVRRVRERRRDVLRQQCFRLVDASRARIEPDHQCVGTIGRTRWRPSPFPPRSHRVAARHRPAGRGT